MYKFNGVGCSPCGGCKSMRGFGVDAVAPVHADAAEDRALMEELLAKYTAVNMTSTAAAVTIGTAVGVVATSTIVLFGMFFVEKYWGNH